jgi:hypothetical protein
MNNPRFRSDAAEVHTRNKESCISAASSSNEVAMDNISLLRKLHEELLTTNISDKQAFDLASKLSPNLVYDNEFLQLFLNAEQSNPISAARRLVGHFAQKLEVWGTDKLCKYLALSDLTNEDLNVISSGGLELLPAKDDTEKSVLVINCWRLKYKSKSNLVRKTFETNVLFRPSALARKLTKPLLLASQLRAFWYMINSTLKNVQRNSIVVVALQYDRDRSLLSYTPPPRLDDDLSEQLAKCAHSLPVRFLGVYRVCATTSSVTTSSLPNDVLTEMIAKENGVSVQSYIGKYLFMSISS